MPYVLRLNPSSQLPLRPGLPRDDVRAAVEQGADRRLHGHLFILGAEENTMVEPHVVPLIWKGLFFPTYIGGGGKTFIFHGVQGVQRYLQ